MNERVKIFKKLRDSFDSRLAYTKAMVSVNVSSQIRSLRTRRKMTQKDLAVAANMKQARISVLEHPGESVNLETLVRLAAAFGVGVIVKFVPFSEMFTWKKNYAPDSFDVVPIEKDNEFLEPRKIAALAEQVEVATESAFAATVGDSDLTLPYSYQPQTPSWIFHGELTQSATATATGAQPIYQT